MRSDRGFTLIELMVVVMIMAVLVSMLLSSYLGARTRAYETRVKADLIHVAKAVAGLSVSGGGYTDDAATIGELVPGIALGSATDSSVRVVVADIAPGDSAQVLMYARAVSGDWFGVRLVSKGVDVGQHTCRGDAEGDMTMAGCAGVDW